MSAVKVLNGEVASSPSDPSEQQRHFCCQADEIRSANVIPRNNFTQKTNENNNNEQKQETKKQKRHGKVTRGRVYRKRGG